MQIYIYMIYIFAFAVYIISLVIPPRTIKFELGNYKKDNRDIILDPI